jgi:hypothetical protein
MPLSRSRPSARRAIEVVVIDDGSERNRGDSEW